MAFVPATERTTRKCEKEGPKVLVPSTRQTSVVRKICGFCISHKSLPRDLPKVAMM